jgi:putative SOS response-associated peptidase YedK
LNTTAEDLARVFQLLTSARVAPRFNIAPTQAAPVVRWSAELGGRRLDELRWGLIPFWSKDAGAGARTINARAESAAEKPSFRQAFRKRRCLVPATGFYEWHRGETPKQPYYLRGKCAPILAFAGLWERYAPEQGTAIDSFAILTTEAAGAVRAIHDRMPVILDPDRWSAWLDPAIEDPARAREILAPSGGDPLEAIAVSRRVNSVRNDDAACLAPIQGA